MALATTAAWAAIDMPRFENALLARFGPAPVPLLRDWQKSLAAAVKAAERAKLGTINDVINQRIQFEDDLTVWNQIDYWATPMETIGMGRGDCEDLAIIKYFSLRNAGIPLAKLRLVYVKARMERASGPYLQAHMVLAYYPTPTADPLVLDNLKTEILPASQRRDLQPVFSFSSEAIFTSIAANAEKGSRGISQLSRWEDLLKRARQEGVD